MAVEAGTDGEPSPTVMETEAIYAATRQGGHVPLVEPNTTRGPTDTSPMPGSQLAGGRAVPPGTPGQPSNAGRPPHTIVTPGVQLVGGVVLFPCPSAAGEETQRHRQADGAPLEMPPQARLGKNNKHGAVGDKATQDVAPTQPQALHPAAAFMHHRKPEAADDDDD